MEITVVDRSGKQKNLEVSVGGSLMESLRDAGYDDIVAICGGNCSCATCHVYIESAGKNALPVISEDEKILLDSLAHTRPNSRLSCQIQINEFLSGSIICIPPEE